MRRNTLTDGLIGIETRSTISLENLENFLYFLYDLDFKIDLDEELKRFIGINKTNGIIVRGNPLENSSTYMIEFSYPPTKPNYEIIENIKKQQKVFETEIYKIGGNPFPVSLSPVYERKTIYDPIYLTIIYKKLENTSINPTHISVDYQLNSGLLKKLLTLNSYIEFSISPPIYLLHGIDIYGNTLFLNRLNIQKKIKANFKNLIISLFVRYPEIRDNSSRFVHYAIPSSVYDVLSIFNIKSNKEEIENFEIEFLELLQKIENEIKGSFSILSPDRYIRSRYKMDIEIPKAENFSNLKYEIDYRPALLRIIEKLTSSEGFNLKNKTIIEELMGIKEYELKGSRIYEVFRILDACLETYKEISQKYNSSKELFQVTTENILLGNIPSNFARKYDLKHFPLKETDEIWINIVERS
ncbi:MAG: hypothetical protein B6U78_01905 [Candidatus Aenigmarchaeota archaeon ex4484_224]|nr:MAG: hypothetical protein B6U78_01905 [Candidatus Aenigmarchaeota archaeon ex4484_224]